LILCVLVPGPPGLAGPISVLPRDGPVASGQWTARPWHGAARKNRTGLLYTKPRTTTPARAWAGRHPPGVVGEPAAGCIPSVPPVGGWGRLGASSRPQIRRWDRRRCRIPDFWVTGRARNPLNASAATFCATGVITRVVCTKPRQGWYGGSLGWVSRGQVFNYISTGSHSEYDFREKEREASTWQVPLVALCSSTSFICLKKAATTAGIERCGIFMRVWDFFRVRFPRLIAQPADEPPAPSLRNKSPR
jgi:hypothetical protein